MHCMLMDLLHGFEVLSTTEETLFNSRNVSRLVSILVLRVVMRFMKFYYFSTHHLIRVANNVNWS